LGSGSDFTPFLQHLGVAALNIGYGGEDDSGIYHSIYDDFYWYTHFSDTSFVYGRALAQTAGTAVMRLADADVLPFAFTNLAGTARGYVRELEQLRDRRADEIAERARELDEGAYTATRDPRAPTAPPPRLGPAPHLNFAPVLDALDSLDRAALRYERAYETWSAAAARPSAGAPANAAALHALDVHLLASERQLTDAAGLPRRPWFRHLLYAPGYYTGYGVKTMPGAREAIEQGEWAEADVQLRRIADALRAEAAHVSRAAILLGGAP
ncbi:MAG TPA: transferrin receptor-like dimerization domain-containing protein, partial [Gemmatirosa sp.]